jgi:hypothetical protein
MPGFPFTILDDYVTAEGYEGRSVGQGVARCSYMFNACWFEALRWSEAAPRLASLLIGEARLGRQGA